MHHKLFIPFAALVWLVAGLAPVPVAFAQNTATGPAVVEFLTPELAVRRVRLSAIDGNTVRFFDEKSVLQSAAISDFVQLRFDQFKKLTPEGKGVVTLTDGTRIAGSQSGSSEDGQAIHWKHPALGEAVIALDDLATMSHDRKVTTQPLAGLDQIVLTNGDRLTGFIFAINAKEIEFQVAADAAGDADSPTIKLAADRIAAVRFANEATPASDAPFFLRINDGTRIGVTLEGIGEGNLLVGVKLPGADAASKVWVDMHRIERIDVIAQGRRLVSLADLPRRIVANGAVFGRTVRPRVIGDDLQLHAPMTLEIDLPAGARRFAAVARIDDQGETGGDHSIQWADFDLTVRAGDKTLVEHHFDADHPRFDINTPIEGDKITFQLDPAANGPIMDRLLLANGMVLINQ